MGRCMSGTIPKVALVTGAARRVGAATVQKLHQQGYNIILHYRGHTKEALALADKLNQRRHDSVRAFSHNLAYMNEIIALAEEAKACWGRLDLLVNNASSYFPTPFGQVTEAEWDELHQSNVKSQFFLTQALAPMLTSCCGNIVNIVDIHADFPEKNYSAYCPQKAALVAVTKSLALELAPHVRVNAIAPGFMLPPEGKGQMTPKAETAAITRIPLQKIGGAAPIADAVYYLANADYVTGAILNVDGGRHLCM